MKTLKIIALALLIPSFFYGQDYDLKLDIVKNDNQPGGELIVDVMVRATSSEFVSGSFSQGFTYNMEALSINNNAKGDISPNDFQFIDFRDLPGIPVCKLGQNAPNEISFGKMMVQPSESFKVTNQWSTIIRMSFTIVNNNASYYFHNLGLGLGHEGKSQTWMGIENGQKISKVFGSNNINIAEEELTHWTPTAWFNQNGRLNIKIEGDEIPQNANASIYNLNGQLIEVLELDRSDVSVSLNQYDSGVYLINIDNSSNMEGKGIKVIKP